MTVKIHRGDCLKTLAKLPDRSVQCVVTSPPYWGLRDYGVAGQIGLEPTPEEYTARMTAVFREVRRVLRDDGTCWVNMGDSYANTGCKDSGKVGGFTGERIRHLAAGIPYNTGIQDSQPRSIPPGLKPKDLCGIPWRLAFALQADGWYLRSDIIWHKPNPMPESVTDRPTKAHEYVFLLTKSARYFYDAEAVREEQTGDVRGRKIKCFPKTQEPGLGIRANSSWQMAVEGHKDLGGRNIRTVWTITPKPFKGAHFATFPPALVERCVKAGTRAGDTVLDPFAGAGTVGLVCQQLGRDHVGIDLNPAYVTMARKRIAAAHVPVEASAS